MKLKISERTFHIKKKWCKFEKIFEDISFGPLLNLIGMALLKAEEYIALQVQPLNNNGSFKADFSDAKQTVMYKDQLKCSLTDQGTLMECD